MWFRMNLACRPVPHWLVRITLDSKVVIEQNPAKKQKKNARSNLLQDSVIINSTFSCIYLLYPNNAILFHPLYYPSHIPVMYTHQSYIYILYVYYIADIHIYNIPLKTTRIHIILLYPLYYTILICICGWIQIVHPPERFTKALVQWRRSELTGLVHPGFHYIICKYVNMFFPIYSICIYIYIYVYIYIYILYSDIPPF